MSPLWNHCASLTIRPSTDGRNFDGVAYDALWLDTGSGQDLVYMAFIKRCLFACIILPFDAEKIASIAHMGVTIHGAYKQIEP